MKPRLGAGDGKILKKRNGIPTLKLWILRITDHGSSNHKKNSDPFLRSFKIVGNRTENKVKFEIV